MKLITLNAWGGRTKEQFIKFITDHNEIDIFCMQEVYNEAWEREEIWHKEVNLDLFNDLKKNLLDYKSFFDPHLENYWGLAFFIKKHMFFFKKRYKKR